MVVIREVCDVSFFASNKLNCFYNTCQAEELVPDIATIKKSQSLFFLLPVFRSKCQDIYVEARKGNTHCHMPRNTDKKNEIAENALLVKCVDHPCAKHTFSNLYLFKNKNKYLLKVSITNEEGSQRK